MRDLTGRFGRRKPAAFLWVLLHGFYQSWNCPKRISSDFTETTDRFSCIVRVVAIQRFYKYINCRFGMTVYLS